MNIPFVRIDGDCLRNRSQSNYEHKCWELFLFTSHRLTLIHVITLHCIVSIIFRSPVSGAVQSATENISGLKLNGERAIKCNNFYSH